MTKIKRIAAVPLILSDPYFSLWSPADCLHDCDTESWTGKKVPIRGYLRTKDHLWRFMGADSVVPALPQVELEITPTQTRYTFENAYVCLKVQFATNLDLADVQKISEPVTIVTTEITWKEEGQEEAELLWQFSDQLCQEDATHRPQVMEWQKVVTPTEQLAWMGKAQQTPLSATGDLIDIDWGYFYVAAAATLPLTIEKPGEMLEVRYAAAGQQRFLVAYDDGVAIQYFGHYQTALWKERYPTMFQLLPDYLAQIEANQANCTRLDTQLTAESLALGGPTLDFLNTVAYRQAICAHKLIRDEQGNILFLSKECSSNGCIGTVDVSYPSIPLFLAYQPELVKGMLRPVYRFAASAVWEYPFAPHDVGRYPYATGQVYGENKAARPAQQERGPRDTVIDLYGYPAGQAIYDEASQMPIEESGNMLLMASLAALLTEDEEFLATYDTLNQQWANYLLEQGQNPGTQLCTDDFAGHLDQNANLSLKAVMALYIYGMAKEHFWPGEGSAFQKAAREMADAWLLAAQDEKIGATRLAFNQPGTWSLKYNLVWDVLLDCQLFPARVREQEVAHYLKQLTPYGVPLDQRATYTKADWQMWVSLLSTQPEQQEALRRPLQAYLEETTSRVPFSDWYDTATCTVMNFKNRSVVGAMYLPHLQQRIQEWQAQHAT